MRKTNFIILTAAIALSFTACKKDTAEPEPFVFYNVSVDGTSVTFTNKSTNAATYEWDFGDGTTSTEESPVHAYPGKGKYVPTLYATSSAGMKGEASTVLQISKTSPVKLDDNTLSDWDTITHNVVMAGAGAGNFIKAKYDYDGNFVYLYFEQKTTQAQGNIYDVYLDADNDITTGFVTSQIQNGAFEVLMEGTIFGGWFDPFYFNGATQSAFSYSPQSISEFYKIGKTEESNGVLKFEWAISRTKIKGLTGTGLKIGVQATANDWSKTLGYSPDQGSNAFYLDMSE